MAHVHRYRARRKNATVLVCDCGRFQHVPSADNPPIVEVTRGQLAYEADCAKTPLYHDKTPRVPWAKLSEIARYSWER